MYRKLMIAGIASMTLFSQLFISPASAAVFADDAELPPPGVVIESVTANGSGCRPGTVTAAVNLDSTAFTVIYSEYIAAVGVGAGVLDFRKNCQVSVLVRMPPEYTYAIVGADYRGFASLAAGATARHRATYYFQGSPDTSLRSHEFTGPFEDSWHVVDEPDIPVLVYHPCGELRNLNINTELRVFRGTSDPTTTTSFITSDSTDTYRFHWKRCP